MFGPTKMVVASEDLNRPWKDAQGSKSDAFKFQSQICAACNGHVTQESDLQYAKLINLMLSSDTQKSLASESGALKTRCSGPISELQVSRYLAKLIGCWLAESGAPIPKSLSALVRGVCSRNSLSYSVANSTIYPEVDELGRPLLAHSGLSVISKSQGGLIRRYLSGHSVGAIRFDYAYHLTVAEALEIQVFFASFASTVHAASA